MIIQRLKLKNFGRHRDLDVSPAASVVGLLGDNGAGKSTVLEAVQFALTGEAPQDQDSYVTFGEANGSVELTFVRNGQVGKIFRQVGKTPKRTLEWEGKQIKKAGEVDEIMSSILGADKKAVSAAVFIPQGDLQNLLFGAQADRETLFIRLVNLAFCEQVAKMIDGKIKKVGATVTDLTAVMDEARTATQQAESSVAAARAGLSGLCDLQTVINRMQERRNVLSLKEAAQLDLKTAHERKLAHVNGLNQYLASREFANVAAVKMQITLLETLAGAAIKEIDRVTKGIAQIEARKHMHTSLSERKAEVAALRGRYEALALQMPPDPETLVVERTNLVRAATEYRQLAHAIDSYEREIARQAQELAALVEPQHAARIEELGAAVAAQRAMLEQNRLWLRKQEELQKCMGKIADGICKDCGLRLSPQQDFDPAAMAQFRHAIQIGEADIAVKEAEAVKLLSEITHYRTQRHGLEQSQKVLQTQLAQQQARLKAVEHAKSINPEELTAEIRTLQERMSEISRLHQDRATAETRVAGIERQIAEIGSLDESQITQEKLTAAQSQRDAINGQLRDLRLFEAEVLRLAREVQSAEQQLQSINDRIEQASNTLIGYPPAPEEIELHEKFSGDATLVQAELQARQDAWLRQNGILIEAQRALTVASQRLNELETRAAQDTKRRTCLQQLQELKALMSRQGLPGKYVAHRFEQLAILTQSHLTRMAAGFDVKIDPEVPLSFRFKRQDDGADLPMTKLSGGQRVRLSLAFLMAVQEALVPDVGLLVLDEPSMHLDVAGKASLAELLTETGRRLITGESQVWVSDHAIELEPAFGAAVRL